MFIDTEGNLNFPKYEFCEKLVIITDVDETIETCFNYEDREFLYEFLEFVKNDKFDSRDYLRLIVESALTGNEFSDFVEYLKKNYNEILYVMQLIIIAAYYENCATEIDCFIGVFNMIYCDRVINLVDLNTVLNDFCHWDKNADMTTGGIT